MNKINIRRSIYHVRQQLTLNNVVISIAFIVAAGWVWGSIGAMQKNYELQKTVDTKSRQLKLAELETKNLEYEQKYYQSSEYQELEVRKRLGLANPGEKTLILPPNSEEAKNADMKVARISSQEIEPASDFQQWMNFLFGGNRQSL